MFDTFKKCFTLIDRDTAWQLFAVGWLILITALLEVLGIGMIFVFVKLLVDPSQIDQLKWLGQIIGPTIAGDETRLLALVSICLLVTFVAKNAFLLFLYYIQARFVARNEALMAERLFDSYLNGAYSLHLTRNSAEFIRNITGSVTTVFATVIVGFLNLTAELVLITALIIVLLLAEPLLTLSAVAVLCSTVGIFYIFSKQRFAKWGQQEQQTREDILQALQQGLHSIKEVKVLGRQNFILSSFEKPRQEQAVITTKITTMTQAPRLWVETVIVTCVLVAVIITLSKSGNSVEILSVLTLFAAAAFRLIPSMNRIIIALNGIKRGVHAVNLVHDDMHLFRDNTDEGLDAGGEALKFTDSISVNGMSFQYAGTDGEVLKDIHLALPRGQSLGLVGPSGAGKTTFVDIVLGLLSPTSGTVTVDGADISGTLRAWRRQIGYVPQAIYIIDDTLRRNVAFGIDDDDIDESKLDKAIRLAQLEELVAKLPNGLGTRLGERGVRLSGGQRQRVGIARALYRDPEVLILDEATSSLDSETEHEINNAIEHLTGEKTLIIIAHRLSTVRKCQRLAFLRDGRLVDIGNFDELNARNADFSHMVELAQL